MIRIKLLLVGLAAAVALTAVSAAPAGAIFKSRNGTSQGQAKIAGVTTLTVGAAAKVSCGGADGEWHLQTKGKFQEHEQGEKQVATTEGPHLYIKITKWNQCSAEVSGVKITKGVEVSACEFQLEQVQKGSPTTGTASVIRPCVITITGTVSCTITVFAGKENQNPELAVNAFLKEIKAVNGQNSILGTANVEGIKGEASCLTGGFSTGTFKSGEGTLIGTSLELV